MVDITFQRRPQRSVLPWVIAIVVILALIWAFAGRGSGRVTHNVSNGAVAPGNTATPSAANPSVAPNAANPSAAPNAANPSTAPATLGTSTH